MDSGYSKFEALIAPSEGFSKKEKIDNIGFVRIHGDGKVLYDSGPIPSDLTKPLNISANIKGVLKLKVEVQIPEEYIGGSVYLGLLDAKLIN